MLNVQTYLSNLVEKGHTSDDAYNALAAEFGIKVKKYEEYGIALLDYDMLASPRHHHIVDECRSLILDLHTFDIISRKFNRFYNVGEVLEYESNFNWNSITVQEKADGSLIGVYYNRNTKMWHISTRGMADASGQWGDELSFHTKVLNAFGIDEEGLQTAFNGWEGSTLVFEYTGPSNHIVTPYTHEEMVLLTIVDSDGYEYTHRDFEASTAAKMVKYRLISTYELKDKNALLSAAQNIDGLKEGFVVRDDAGMRLKVKSPLYVKAHKLRGNGTPSPNAILEIVLMGEEDEVLAYFPGWKSLVDDAKHMVTSWISNVAEVYEAHRHYTNQKDFALAIQATPGTPGLGLMFLARKLGIEVVDAFNGLDIPKRLSMLTTQTTATQSPSKKS